MAHVQQPRSQILWSWMVAVLPKSSPLPVSCVSVTRHSSASHTSPRTPGRQDPSTNTPLYSPPLLTIIVFIMRCPHIHIHHGRSLLSCSAPVPLCVVCSARTTHVPPPAKYRHQRVLSLWDMLFAWDFLWLLDGSQGTEYDPT